MELLMMFLPTSAFCFHLFKILVIFLSLLYQYYFVLRGGTGRIQRYTARRSAFPLCGIIAFLTLDFLGSRVSFLFIFSLARYQISSVEIFAKTSGEGPKSKS